MTRAVELANGDFYDVSAFLAKTQCLARAFLSPPSL